MQEARNYPNQANDHLSPLSAEKLSNPELVDIMLKHYPQITAKTALSAAVYINHLYANVRGSVPKEVIDKWKIEIDAIASEAMASQLKRLPFLTNKVGSEGDKEEQYTGETASSVKGFYGKNNEHLFWGVSDVVEGTSLAARNKPGASSVLAITPPFGIMPAPATSEKSYYMVKLIAAPQAKGILNLDNYNENSLHQYCEKLGIYPHELTQVSMNPDKPGREINQKYIDIGRKAGLNIKLIDTGDFIRGVKAAIDPEMEFDLSNGCRASLPPTILVGRGGFEEGLLSATATRALGSFMQARRFNQDADIMQNYPLWTLDDLVPAKKDEVLLANSYITADPALILGSKGVEYNHITNQYETMTMTITHQGIKFLKHKFDARYVTQSQFLV